MRTSQGVVYKYNDDNNFSYTIIDNNNNNPRSTINSTNHKKNMIKNDKKIHNDKKNESIKVETYDKLNNSNNSKNNSSTFEIMNTFLLCSSVACHEVFGSTATTNTTKTAPTTYYANNNDDDNVDDKDNGVEARYFDDDHKAQFENEDNEKEYNNDDSLQKQADIKKEEEENESRQREEVEEESIKTNIIDITIVNKQEEEQTQQQKQQNTIFFQCKAARNLPTNTEYVNEIYIIDKIPKTKANRSSSFYSLRSTSSSSSLREEQSSLSSNITGSHEWDDIDKDDYDYDNTNIDNYIFNGCGCSPFTCAENNDNILFDNNNDIISCSSSSIHPNIEEKFLAYKYQLTFEEDEDHDNDNNNNNNKQKKKSGNNITDDMQQTIEDYLQRFNCTTNTCNNNDDTNSLYNDSILYYLEQDYDAQDYKQSDNMIPTAHTFDLVDYNSTTPPSWIIKLLNTFCLYC